MQETSQINQIGAVENINYKMIWLNKNNSTMRPNLQQDDNDDEIQRHAEKIHHRSAG